MGFEWYGKSILILGCGNKLLGDDGFGPAVVQCLDNKYAIPEQVCVMDVGTSVREVLFDIILSDKKPSKIIIVDAMDCGRKPGELFSPDIDSLPRFKLEAFSIHQTPTSNMLREIRELCGIEVVIIASQVQETAEYVKPGLSKPLIKAVESAAEILSMEHFG